MLKNNQTAGYSNESYQRALADNLIKSLGLDEAINACYDHDWMETLNFVKSRKSEAVCH
tara:strand:- start:762 stop:938 length:177 start_codon:yes stop_codon:yes gene_type:complete